MAVAQRPFAEAAFGGVSGPIAWRSIPFWYILGTEDKAIPPATQREMANRGGATIVEVRVSQASMASHPDAMTGPDPDRLDAVTRADVVAAVA